MLKALRQRQVALEQRAVRVANGLAVTHVAGQDQVYLCAGILNLNPRVEWRIPDRGQRIRRR